MATPRTRSRADAVFGRRRALPCVVLALVLGGCVLGLRGGAGAPDGDGPAYGHDPGGTRYSPLAQIHRGNVTDLRVAWTYRTGDLAEGAWASGRIAFEATPIMVDNTLYLSTPFGRVVALDPETGAERWTYDPKVDRNGLFVIITSRGVSTWLDPTADAGQPCRRRIFLGTLDARLIALDATTGAPWADFGRGGEVSLAEGVLAQPTLVTVARDGRRVPAVGTKMGHMFVPHRETGAPLFPVEERPVPKSTVPGEEAWPTQPFPLKPRPLAKARLAADDAWGLTPAARWPPRAGPCSSERPATRSFAPSTSRPASCSGRAGFRRAVRPRR